MPLTTPPNAPMPVVGSVGFSMNERFRKPLEKVWKAIAAEDPETTEQDLFDLWLAELRAVAVIKRFVSD